MATETEPSESKPSNTRRGTRRRRRVWALRASAMLLGVALFGLVELVLVLFGVGAPDYHDDPFAGFSSVRATFRFE